MSLSDELAEFAASEPTRPNRCKVAALFAEIGPDAAAILAHLIDETKRPATEIAVFMASRGHDVASRAYQDHRRRDRSEGCHCPKASA